MLLQNFTICSSNQNIVYFQFRETSRIKIFRDWNWMWNWMRYHTVLQEKETLKSCEKFRKFYFLQYHYGVRERTQENVALISWSTPKNQFDDESTKPRLSVLDVAHLLSCFSSLKKAWSSLLCIPSASLLAFNSILLTLISRIPPSWNNRIQAEVFQHCNRDSWTGNTIEFMYVDLCRRL